jgi:hypothetical protein
MRAWLAEASDALVSVIFPAGCRVCSSMPAAFPFGGSVFLLFNAFRSLAARSAVGPFQR